MKRINGSGPFAAQNSESELLRAVGLCHPSWFHTSQLTFAPDMACSPTWLHWKQDVFVPVILPAMQGAQNACATGNPRALKSCDNAIDAALSADGRRASRTAGTSLIEAYSAPRSEKLWTRYRALVISGELPGHLAIIAVVRAVAFHLPVAAMVGAYVFLEAKGGMPGEGILQWNKMVCDCLTAWRRLDNFNLRAA
jgi:UreF-like urease accessory protein